MVPRSTRGDRYRRDAMSEPLPTAAPKPLVCETPRHAIFSECPHCGAGMRPEHAHYRCSGCGWRDSCCD